MGSRSSFEGSRFTGYYSDGRKVRSPQSSVPANGRGSGNGPRKVPQKIYRLDGGAGSQAVRRGRLESLPHG